MPENYSDYASATAAARARVSQLPPGELPGWRWHLLRSGSQPIEGPDLPPDVHLEPLRPVTAPAYRALYILVGRDWLWDARRRAPDSLLEAVLKASEVTILYRGRTVLGYYELTPFPHRSRIELSYFGLAPHATGQGLGPAFLAASCRRMAELAPGLDQEVNTCIFDHPAALKLYQRLGFVIDRQEPDDGPDPRLEGLIDRAAAPHVPLG